MTGVPGFVCEARGQGMRLMVWYGLKQGQRPFGVGHGVERLDYGVFDACRLALLTALVQELGVFLLDVGGVAQHPAAAKLR